MTIKTTIEINCPSGFYCGNCGWMKRMEGSGETYCEIFYPFLDVDSECRTLKCEKCLLAEREERIKK